MERLDQCVVRARKFNSREDLFGKDLSDYSKIQQCIKDFTPHNTLWKTTHSWHKGIVHWLNDKWDTIDADEAENFCLEGGKALAQCLRVFKEKDPIKFAAQIKIAEKIKANIDEFKPKAPLLVALRKEGMMERHWTEISTKSGIEINPEMEGFNFQMCLDRGLLQHVALAEEVGEKAFKEFNIEKQLDIMEEEWKDVNFELIQFKQTASFLVKGFDDVEQVLDEHLSLAGAMVINPFKKPFEERIDDWLEKLVTISNVVEAWRAFQKDWKYLQPIFDSPDIARKLPAESNLFKRADNIWKQTTNMIKTNPNVLRVCTAEHFLNKIEDANDMLEKITKELNTYLENTRGKFARFYFLSNDQLLHILSQVKEVERVQEHLRSIFENVATLDFNPDKTIKAMYSVEKERVAFNNLVNPNQKQVEDWLGEVEVMMQESVRHV